MNIKDFSLRRKKQAECYKKIEKDIRDSRGQTITKTEDNLIIARKRESEWWYKGEWGYVERQYNPWGELRLEGQYKLKKILKGEE